MKTPLRIFSALALTIIGSAMLPSHAVTTEENRILEQRGPDARQAAERKTEQIIAARNPTPPLAKPTESSPVVDEPVDETDSPASAVTPASQD